MPKIMLCGSNSLNRIPDEAVNLIYKMSKLENYEFLVGDYSKIDREYQMLLSSLGAVRRTKVYAIDVAKNNRYSMDTVIIRQEDFDKLGYKEEDYTKVIDYEIIEACDAAVLAWKEDDKRILNILNHLKMRDKQTKTFKV